MTLKQQQGSALITVLLIVSIVTIIAASVVWRFHSWVQYASQVTLREKMLIALEGMQDWGLAELQTQPPKLIKIGPIHYQGMQLYGRLEDQQGKFNINTLMDIQVEKQNRFIHLLKIVDPTLSQNKTSFITMSIVRKILLSNPLTSFLDTSEIRDVPGMTSKLYRRLKPYITALPTNKMLKTNINSVSAPMLMSLLPTLTINQANLIVICAKNHGVFSNLNDFNTKCLLPFQIPTLPNIGVTSHYYVVNTEAKSGSRTLHLKRLLYLQSDNKTIKATVLWQKIR